jgi:hypothetical protein
MTIATNKIRKSGNQRLVQNSFVHEIPVTVFKCALFPGRCLIQTSKKQIQGHM